MQDNNLQINIEQPCSQSWSDMQSTEQGGFCKSCQKEVVDFTQMSDRELLDYFAIKHQRKTCGRMRRDQLQRDLSYPYIQQPMLYPNPFTQQINMELDWHISEYAFIRLLSSDAKTVFEERQLLQAGKQSFNLNIQDALPASNYILVIENSQGEVFSKIVVKAE